MRIWVDDLRPLPASCHVWCRSVNEVKKCICRAEEDHEEIEYLDLDHDAGDYAADGGDFIHILDWMERTGRAYPIRMHTMNPVGRSNMIRIIRRNGWRLLG